VHLGLSLGGLNATRDGSHGLVQIKDPRIAEIAESAFNNISTERTIIAIDVRKSIRACSPS
jgi:hypothetical protein